MHQLVLMRHAKAAWPQGVPDQDRPLAQRGRDDAGVAAGLFGRDVPVPGLVLCSPALRTRQTWEIACAQIDPAPPIRYEDSIYGARTDDLIDLAHAMAEDTATVLMLGHNPTMARTVLALVGPASSDPAVAQVQRKFPTCAIAVLTLDAAWADLAPGAAALESVSIPRN